MSATPMVVPQWAKLRLLEVLGRRRSWLERRSWTGWKKGGVDVVDSAGGRGEGERG